MAERYIQSVEISRSLPQRSAVCLDCAKRELYHVWHCTDTRHFLKCYHVVDTQPPDCAYNCRNVPQAQPRNPYHECRACKLEHNLYEFLRKLYSIKAFEDEIISLSRSGYSERELDAMRAELRQQKNELRRSSLRIFWLAYPRNGSWYLHKLLFRMWRHARRRKRAARCRHLKRWMDMHERPAAMFFVKGLRWLRRRHTDVVGKKMSDRPSRFEAYVQLRALANES